MEQFDTLRVHLPKWPTGRFIRLLGYLEPMR
jgi:hypothetical protein